MYADKEYYMNTFYAGNEPKLSEAECTMYLRKASVFLDSLFVSKRPSEPYEPCVKDACCEIADCLYVSESRAGIASENNDGYSVTYTAKSDSSSASADAHAIAQRYLAHTGLLYRGIG